MENFQARMQVSMNALGRTGINLQVTSWEFDNTDQQQANIYQQLQGYPGFDTPGILGPMPKTGIPNMPWIMPNSAFQGFYPALSSDTLTPGVQTTSPNTFFYGLTPYQSLPSPGLFNLSTGNIILGGP